MKRLVLKAERITEPWRMRRNRRC